MRRFALARDRARRNAGVRESLAQTRNYSDFNLHSQGETAYKACDVPVSIEPFAQSFDLH